MVVQVVDCTNVPPPNGSIIYIMNIIGFYIYDDSFLEDGGKELGSNKISPLGQFSSKRKKTS